MKTTLTLDVGTEHAVTSIEIYTASCPCPLCKLEPLHFQAIGTPVKHSDDRTVECAAFCLDCRKQIGTIRVVADTIFGLTEDDTVINHSRCRVYGK